MNAQVKEFTRRSEFWAGARSTIPLEIGGIPFGIIFGASAINSGISPLGVMGMSLFVFAGSAQFIAAQLVAQGVGVGIIILTTFVINLRHALYSTTLAPHVKHLSQRWLLPLGFWLTDETFVIAIGRYGQADNSPYKHWFYLGSAVSMYVMWQICTLIGVVAGQNIPNMANLGLDFALIVTFIGMLIPLIKNRPLLLSAVVGGVSAVLLNGLPNKLGLMAAALLGVAAGVIAEMMIPETPAQPDEVLSTSPVQEGNTLE